MPPQKPIEERPLTERQIATLQVFTGKPKRAHEAAKQLGYSESAHIFGSVTALRRKGYLSKSGWHKNTKYKTKKPDRI